MNMISSRLCNQYICLKDIQQFLVYNMVEPCMGCKDVWDEQMLSLSLVKTSLPYNKHQFFLHMTFH
jgi:hypothetical protein